VIPAFILVDKILEKKRHVAHLQITAAAQLMRNVCRDILRPFLGSVERDDPNWAFVLPLKQVDDHRFQIGSLYVGFTPDPAMAAKVIQNEVIILIIAIRDDRGHPASPTHTQLHATEPGFKREGLDSFHLLEPYLSDCIA
jgi:hypothetical protein